MTSDVLMAGFGGQGMLLAGKILARAAMDAGLEVSWLPSYGPEMRGGTANVIVRVSSEPIGSPLVSRPHSLLVMNLPSLEKFASSVQPAGVIVINSSLVARDPQRDDCTVFKVDARKLAVEASADRAANFVMLGAYVAATNVVPPENVAQAIADEFTGRKSRFVPGSRAAFLAGLAEVHKAEVTA
jgi:2-oxoglutarate ferredoxin oxidoreductase subunit gamma